MYYVEEDVFKCCLCIGNIFNRVKIESCLNCCLFVYIHIVCLFVYIDFVCLFFTYFISITLGNRQNGVWDISTDSGRFLVTYAQMNGLFSQSGQDFLQLCLKFVILKVRPLVEVKFFFWNHGSYGYSKEAYLAHDFNAKNQN